MKQAHITFRAALLGLAFALPVAALAQNPPAHPAPAGQQNFASPDDAVNALVKALQANDTNALQQIFGPAGSKFTASGDAAADSAARKTFLAAYNQSHTLTPQPDGSEILVAGDNGWPLPIPLVQTAGHWQFDTSAGTHAIAERHIGRNELLTIQTLLSAVAAEQDYFQRTQAASNGAGLYAQRLFSTQGQHDGLYWPAAAGQPDSPLAPLIAQSPNDGYPGAVQNGHQVPYHGYYFHLLKYQGANAPGGQLSYIQNGKMTDGFAFMAWPVIYGTSGIMTFIVNQDGTVFQKDLGPQTTKTVATINAFDPDLSWARVDVGD